MNIKIKCSMLYMLFSVLSASARVPLNAETRAYLMKQAEATFNKMGDVARVKEVVSQEVGAAARSLSLDTVATRGGAVANLSRVQVEKNKGRAGKTISLGTQATENATSQDVLVYGRELIRKASKYSVLFDIAGLPTIEQHREGSLALFLEQVDGDSKVAEQVKAALFVHKKVMSKFNGAAQGYQQFIEKIEAYVRQHYDFEPVGIAEELIFKIFEAMVYRASDDVFSQQWRAIQSSNDIAVIKQKVVVLLRTGLEAIQKDLQHAPAIEQLKGDVEAYTSKITSMLAEDGISLTAKEQGVPLAIASRAAAHIKKMRDSGSAEKTQHRLQEYLASLDKLSFLLSDYDIIARDVADSKAFERASEELSQVPASDRRVITGASSLNKEVLMRVEQQNQEEPEGEEEGMQDPQEESAQAGDYDGGLSRSEFEQGGGEDYFAAPRKRSGSTIAGIVAGVVGLVALFVCWRYRAKMGAVLQSMPGIGKYFSKGEVKARL